MKINNIETKSLKLVLQTPEDIQAQIAKMTPSEKAELSAHWLALIEAAASSDPWVHGFELVRKADDVVVGRCGFKGPPSADGIVEIAYGVSPEHEGNGYATAAAQALVSFAGRNEKVCVVRAHTLPEGNASTRVLVKSGFQRIGEVMDPDDGLVWRWEKRIEVA